MEMPRLNKCVRKVVKLQRDEKGLLVPTLVYRAETRKKKASGPLRPLEKAVRKLARSHSKVTTEYLRRHNRSNEKRKDGWLKDMVSNVTRAEEKGRKTLTKNSLEWPKIVRMG